MAAQRLAGEHVHLQVHHLPGVHAGELGFLEVGHHERLLQRHHRQHRRARGEVGAHADRASADHAVDRRAQFGVRQVQLGPRLRRFGALHRRLRGLHASSENAGALACGQQRRPPLVQVRAGHGLARLCLLRVLHGTGAVAGQRAVPLLVGLGQGQFGLAHIQRGARLVDQ